MYEVIIRSSYKDFIRKKATLKRRNPATEFPISFFEIRGRGIGEKSQSERGKRLKESEITPRAKVHLLLSLISESQ